MKPSVHVLMRVHIISIFDVLTGVSTYVQEGNIFDSAKIDRYILYIYINIFVHTWLNAPEAKVPVGTIVIGTSAYDGTCSTLIIPQKQKSRYMDR